MGVGKALEETDVEPFFPCRGVSYLGRQETSMVVDNEEGERI